MRKFCEMDAGTKYLLKAAIVQFNLSGRHDGQVLSDSFFEMQFEVRCRERDLVRRIVGAVELPNSKFKRRNSKVWGRARGPTPSSDAVEGVVSDDEDAATIEGVGVVHAVCGARDAVASDPILLALHWHGAVPHREPRWERRRQTAPTASFCAFQLATSRTLHFLVGQDASRVTPAYILAPARSSCVLTPQTRALV